MDRKQVGLLEVYDFHLENLCGNHLPGHEI